MSKAEHTPIISVIIPVWNDSKRIIRCIDALKRQSLARHLFEIIVIDNVSTDNTYEVLSRIDGISLLQESKPGSYAARNKAINIAKGTYLAFTDSDCLPDKKWLEELISCAQSDDKIGIVAGDIAFFQDPEDNVEKEALAFESLFSMNQESYADEGLCITANWCSRKKVVLAQSGFRTDLKSGGDHDMARKITASGLEVKYCENAKVLHPARNSTELLKKRRRVIGGAWDKNNSSFKPLRMLINSCKLFLKRFCRVITAPKYSIYQKTRIVEILLRILWASMSEIFKLAFGKESSRS
ncbi:MAG: glycosyltransferase family 2 protein [Alteromonadaceae bacterium TMED7]|uniref:glycosyltransferase n=1 Tax=Alteromonas sp. TaxID=232 RepID=UPI000B66C6C4|nr:glycosyltransferase family 2 protein [Alteromonas sp.]MAI37133.1 dolichyl-phosphate mannose synthase [Alteromonas sp.]RPH16075.1 MAG: glycosyltransferase family 2 protein [Alteromonadaceae bacterium TMED7]|tara:strand:- start:7529 stop:8419 length:891 start_codon:yes stop_codon:yes gene_type:complete